MISILPFMEDTQQTELIFKLRVAQSPLSKILDNALEIFNLVLHYDSALGIGEKSTSLHNTLLSLQRDFSNAVNQKMWNTPLQKDHEEWLKDLKPVTDAKHKETNACLPGTRIWLLNELCVALAGKANIVWIWGAMGSGKSTIASSVAGMLGPSLGGSFFFRKGFPGQDDIKNLIPTICVQLAKACHPFGFLLVEALKSTLMEISLPTFREQFNYLLLGPLEQLKAQKVKMPVYVLVIDGMEECQGSSRDIVSMLCSIPMVAPWLKLFIADTTFNSSIVRGMSVVISDFNIDEQDEESKRQDMLFYLNHWTSRYGTLGKFYPSEQDQQIICDKSSGNFLWVITLLRYISSRASPRASLETMLETNAFNQQHQSSEDMIFSLYTFILTSHDGDDGNVLVKILQSLLGTLMAISKYSHLPFSSLMDLARIKLHGQERDNVTMLLKSFYDEDEESHSLFPLHGSFLSYMEKCFCPKDLFIDTEEANSSLAENCLKLLLKLMRFNPGEFKTCYNKNEETEPAHPRNLNPALRYACLHWSNHLEDSKSISLAQVEHLSKFLCGPLSLFWIERLSLLQKVDICISSLKKIEGMLKDYPELHIIVQEILCFIIKFWEPITTSTPHLYVSALAWLPSKANLASLWLPHFEKRVCTYGEYTEESAETDTPALAITYSPQGNFLAAGYGDGSVKIWYPASGFVVYGPKFIHSKGISSIQYTKDGANLITGSLDSTLKMWDFGVTKSEFIGHTDAVTAFALSPDGHSLVSASMDHTIRTWELTTGSGILTLEGHTQGVTSVIYSPDGSMVLSASLDNSIVVWDTTDNWSIRNTYFGHTDWVQSISFSPDGMGFASGSTDKTIKIWGVPVKLELAGEPLTGHNSVVHTVAYSPDGHFIYSGSSDKSIRFWNTVTESVSVIDGLIELDGEIFSISVSPDGRYIAAGGGDCSVVILDSQSGAVFGQILKGHTSRVRSVAWSPNGKQLASGSEDRTIKVWDFPTRESVGEPLKGHRSGVSAIAYSPDGLLLVSGSNDCTIRIWDVASGQPKGEPLTKHHSGVECIAFSPGGKLFASGSNDSTLRIWDVERGAQIMKFNTGQDQTFSGVTFSRNGAFVIGCSSNCTVGIWNVLTGEAVCEPVIGHKHWVRAVAISPDGKNLVTGSTDCMLQRYKIEASGGNLAELEASVIMSSQDEFINSLAYSPSSKHIAFGTDDNLLRIWDIQTRNLAFEPLPGHKDSILAVTFSPDGRYLASSSMDGLIKIWDTQMTSDQLMDEEILPTNKKIKKIDPDGWVRNSKGNLLFWVPPEKRSVLQDLSIATLPPGADDYAVLDCSKASHGQSWAEIYTPIEK
ncbi:WD40 repeat-like protein [Schizopora paradoxa]|uniref:WD40 repeat-like protein n=1 Tax=Schizopora paradoxa TaxID=27342 RepID=A0A0H2S6B1_9AGAM|nr:WD40 repeat-like protein [Schizopora paradoxa]